MLKADEHKEQELCQSNKLCLIEKIHNERLNKVVELIEQGVEFVDPYTVYIDETVTVGKGTVIGPSVIIRGGSKIGSGVTIHQNCRIENSIIGNDVVIDQSVILDSQIGDESSIGPFAYLRPKSIVGKKCKIGDFVEVKNSVIGDGTKASHLTYIGDGDLGRNINLGCGVVFVNYDGTKKHRTVIEDGCFVGCNVNLVSPVKVEKGAYIAAGTTVTDNVESDALCIGRQKQRVIANWAKTKSLYRK